ncbi:Kinesin- motor protein [Datura stramonium]|uniref:Kinesin- motor protein n=1 Tax=Datura stramonium TaxID=4076 RepID=A0ABS8UU20_DATST|nr:Kinesin- motor protein [Datura stramonium]
MLQRAATNAYSWWAASHIRTKQSKWLEQSLQDMEEKVEDVIKLIEEDGDSFAKRAEMYYKKRPELINFVEESYRAYRALAERYDKLSRELQSANNTIATLFPEQIQLAMDEEDDYGTPRMPKSFPQTPTSGANIPNAPAKDLKGLLKTGTVQFLGKKSSNKARDANKDAPKSGLTKDEALEEIDKLQRDILSLQTVKEFVKSSYQSGIAKTMEIEHQIIEKHQKICSLEDEFGEARVIEDGEARTLMAEAALQSCQETLAQLQEKQEQSTKEAKEEFRKIEEARKKLKSFRQKYLGDPADETELDEKDESAEAADESSECTSQEEVSEQIESSHGKINEQFDASSMSSLTVTQLAEKIDELVNKVVSLETAVSTQTVLIERLRTEACGFHTQVQILEDDKAATLTEDTHNLNIRVTAIEEKLKDIQDLNKDVKNQNSSLKTHFAEAHTSLGQLSFKLTSVKPDEEVDETDSSQDEEEALADIRSQEEPEKRKDHFSRSEVKKEHGQDHFSRSEVKKEHGQDHFSRSEVKKEHGQDHFRTSEVKKEHGQDHFSTSEVKKEHGQDHFSTSEVKKEHGQDHFSTSKVEKEQGQDHFSTSEVEKQQGPVTVVSDKEVQEGTKTPKKHAELLQPTAAEKGEERVSSQSENSVHDEPKPQEDEEKDDDLTWQQMLLTGLEDKEKILLTEYTTILRNYKELKRKLIDMEKKERDTEFEVTLQIRELKSIISRKDEEIESLRLKLSLLQGSVPVSSEPKEEKQQDLNPSDDRSLKPEDSPKGEDKDEQDFKIILIDQRASLSPVEEKLRMGIDALLDENLDFWLRFSSAFHQVQKFRTTAEDLQGEISTLRHKQAKEGSSKTDMKSEIRPIYKHLREIQNELTLWLEQSLSLKDELKRRFSSLCSIQEEITKALKEGVEEEEIRFSSHQAAKFQGEVLNMKQENNKVREELEAGVEHITTLQVDVEKTLRKLDQEFDVSGSQPQLTNSASRSKIPLRAFIFGTKAKKKRSFFNTNRKYQVLKGGVPL